MNKKEKRKIKRDIDLYKKGIVSGGAVASLGGLGYISSKVAENLEKKIDKLDIANKPVLNKDSVKSLKKASPLLIASGLSLAGFSKYKHYKSKKKLENDNTKE